MWAGSRSGAREPRLGGARLVCGVSALDLGDQRGPPVPRGAQGLDEIARRRLRARLLFDLPERHRGGAHGEELQRAADQRLQMALHVGTPCGAAASALAFSACETATRASMRWRAAPESTAPAARFTASASVAQTPEAATGGPALSSTAARRAPFSPS